MHRLVTIPFSHYNEKARWSLDHFGIRYREIRCLPGFHLPVTALATLGRADNQADAVSSRYSTPVLVTGDGRRVCDSSRILRWAAQQSGDERFVQDHAMAFDQRFGEGLGAHTRRVAYSWIMDREDVADELLERNAGPMQRRLHRMAWPRIRAAMKRNFDLTPDRVASSLERIRSEFAFADECLRGREFFVSGHFTAADLGWACMAAPVLWLGRSEGFAAQFPDSARLNRSAQRLIAEFRSRPSGAHALRMFRQHRAGI